VLQAWPKSAQLATALLLGLAVAFLAIHSWGSSRWATRPTEMQGGSPILYRIDLNRADRAELLQLPGVGETLAERIEAHRREHGPFASVEELRKVRGIGPATLEQLRPWVYVRREEPEEGSEAPAVATHVAYYPPKPPAASPGKEAGGKKVAALDRAIDINRATAEELQKLPGIGPRIAQRIVDERGKGPFKSVDELRRVSGIGAKTLDKLRPFVTVDGSPARPAQGEESRYAEEDQ
jgi:competence protein ComEA